MRWTKFSFMLMLVLLASCKKDQRPLVVSKIKAAAKLATTEVTIDKYVFATKEKKLLFFIPVNEAYFAAKTEAIVKLGVDLDKLKKENVDITDQYVSIKLPPIEVLDFSYPFEKFEVDTMIRDDAFLNKITVQDIEDYYRQGEKDIRENLPYMGLVDQAKANTRNLMNRLLSGLGYKEIYIDFEEQDTLIELIEEPEIDDI